MPVKITSRKVTPSVCQPLGTRIVKAPSRGSIARIKKIPEDAFSFSDAFEHAAIAIIPLQDLLVLDATARFKKETLSAKC
jgi:hypothetical protein